MAAGYWSTTTYRSIRNTGAKVMILEFTANTADHTIPDYTFSAADLAFVQGLYLYFIQTNPGATGPTNGAWDVTIKDANGYEILGNAADNLSSTDTQTKFPLFDGANISYPIMASTSYTITIEGNAVNSANAVIELYFVGSI